MRIRQLVHSLRFRVTVGVLLPLLVILSMLAYVRHNRYQDLLLANLQRSAAHAGEIIEGSLQHAMLTNDFTTLGQIVDDIGQQTEVRDLLLLGKPGHVLISTEPEMVGTTIDLEDATCQACHQYEAASRNENVILDLGDGSWVFRNVNAIENRPECTTCHNPGASVLGVLIADFDLAPVEQALATDRRDSLLWSAGSIALVTLVVDLLMINLIVKRLEQIAGVVRRVGYGDLDARVADSNGDEIGMLGRTLNRMAEGLKEKQRLEESLKEQTKQLQSQAEKLSTLNTIATTVSQSLNLQEILNSALDKVLELMQLRAIWVVLREEQSDGYYLAASRGIPEDVARTHVQCAWNRYACADVLEGGQSRVFEREETAVCSTVAYLEQKGLLFRACIPLRSKDRILGVMSLAADAAESGQALTEDTLEMLSAIGRQIGMAVENAGLYEELRQEEMLRRRLLERVITVQEEERKRIALELHDQTGQTLTSLIMTLGVLGESESLAQVREHLQDLRDTAAQVLREVHDLSLELRPSVLDDLGLLPALRHLHKEYENRFRIPVDLAVLGLDQESGRLPPHVETALYRIVQEALTNVARHTQATSVSVLLEKHGPSVKLIVEDNGAGFDVAGVLGTQPRDKLGLYSMRERASLLEGTLTIESTPGRGTTVFVEIPLQQKEAEGGQDSPAGR